MDINPFEVRGNESLARRAHENRVRRAVRLLKIEPFMRRTLLSLSNGETQRVELAKVLCRPLRLLILDEPYAGLDSGMRRYLESILEHLMGSSLRVMLITTRLEDLPPGLTHAAVVEQCRLVAEDPCEDVLPRLRRRTSRMSTNPGLAFPLFKQIGRKAVLPSNSVRALVRIKDLTLQHGQRVLFKQFNWEIHAGQSWALVGPNGSGKTTLLSLIAGDNPQAYASGLEVFGRWRGSGGSPFGISSGR
jgi:molybdate transport system ATP-binding protein